MNQKTIRALLAAHKIPSRKIQKIDVGFSNELYDIDNRHILKVCKELDNERFFRIEMKLYGFFQGKLPVPEVLVYDDSKSVVDRSYMIYPKIEGENLYNVWHTLADNQRRRIVQQLCSMLKLVNQTDLSSLPKDLALPPMPNWKNHVLRELDKYLSVAESMKTLSDTEIDAIRKFAATNSQSLSEQKIALVYWDAHFDNVLVDGNRIVGLLDFERTELASIDFALDVVRRMVEFPKKYMSEQAERFAKDEDYQNLLVWYEEFYPELFRFPNLNRRLDIYSIVHDLRDLESWPHAKLKENIFKIVS